MQIRNQLQAEIRKRDEDVATRTAEIQRLTEFIEQQKREFEAAQAQWSDKLKTAGVDGMRAFAYTLLVVCALMLSECSF